MTDIGWGNLAQYEHYGRVGDVEEDFDIISYEDSKGELYSSFKHASHAMLFARNDVVLWDLYKSRAAIMTLGMIRPPLYTMGDGYRGLPAFLSNSYAGNSRQELLIGLQHFKILAQDEIEKAVDAWKTFMKTNRQTCGLTYTDS